MKFKMMNCMMQNDLKIHLKLSDVCPVLCNFCNFMHFINLCMFELAVSLAEPQCQTERSGGHGTFAENCRVSDC